jgi:hypothetical protein
VFQDPNMAVLAAGPGASQRPSILPGVAILAAGAIAIFGIPWFIPFRQPVNSLSYTYGFNNFAAWVAVAALLAGSIAEDVGKVLHGRRTTSGRIPPQLLVEYIASTFVLVLNWWVESESPLKPKEVDHLFRSLTLPTVAAFLD